MTARRHPDPFIAAVTDAAAVLNARLKPLHDAIVVSVPLLCDAYLQEVARLFRATDQRHTNDRLRTGIGTRPLHEVRRDAKPASEIKVADNPPTPIVRQL